MALTKITPQMFDTSAAGHDFNIDNGTFVVDASANRVGIGTTTPSTLLDVNGALTATTIAGTLTTAAQTNITSLGTLTALTIDDITIDGSTISDAGGFLIDVGGDIALDADGGDINFKDGGTLFGQISNASGLYLVSNISDADIFIRGNDGGSMVNAVTLDMSEGGNATFSGSVTADERVIVTGNTNNYSTAPLIYFDSTSTANAGVRDWAIGPADDSYGNFHIFVGASTGADPVGNAGRVVTITNTGNVSLTGSGNTALSINTGNNSGDNSQIKFGDTVDDDVGQINYDHGTNAMQFRTNGASNTLILDNSGNVGIGVNSPSSYYAKNLVVMADGDGTGGITIAAPATDDNTYLAFADGTSGAATYAGYVGYSHSSEYLFFGAGAATTMYVKSGSVGIGAAPDTTGFGGTFKYLGVNGGSGYGVFNGQTSSTTANDAAVSFFGSTTGSSGYKLLGGMQVINDTSSASNAEGRLVFYTSTGGSIYERMRINRFGDPIFTGGSSATLEVRAPTDNAFISLYGGFNDSGAEEAGIALYQNQTPKWQIANITSNDFRIYNYATSSPNLLISSGGGVTMPKQPYVQGRGNAGWTAFSSSAIWEIQPHGSTPITSVDRNSNYSTTNKRFTCPVDGVYLVMASWYIYQTAAASAGGQYIHPALYKNGSVSWNSNVQPYTIVGYEIDRSGTGSKHYDGVQIAFTVYCSAGDYLDIRAYTPNSNTQSYENYHYFSYTLLS